jgi:CRP-like cAMP-binding protein
MADAKLDALSRVPLFANLSHRELQFLSSQVDEVEVPAGQTLIRKGEPASSMFLLLDGEAEVHADGSARPRLRPGEFFGEISMLDLGPATATVVTSKPSRMLVMSHQQFRDAIKSNDSLLQQVLSTVALRLRRDSLARLAAE